MGWHPEIKNQAYQGEIIFYQERIAVGNIVVKRFPTRQMLADHLTKPLQGALL